MRKSFSLIEVVISLGIVALVLAALLGLSNSAVKTSVSSAQRVMAANLARAGLDTLRQIRYTGSMKVRTTPTDSCYGLENSSDTNYVFLNYTLPAGCNPPAVVDPMAVAGNAQILDSAGNPTGIFEAPAALGSYASDAFARTIVIEKRDSLQSGLIKATVNVFWKENNQQKMVRLESYFGLWQ